MTSPSLEESELAENWSRRLAYEPAGRPTIDAEVIRALLTGESLAWTSPPPPVAPGAVRIKGVTIAGSLDITAVKGRVGGGAVPQFEAEDCDFDAVLNLNFAVMTGLWLLGCRLPALWIRDARIDGRLDLGGSRIAGVGGDRAASGLVAVLGDGAQIGGDLILSPHGGDRFVAHGAVTLVGATIDGQVVAAGASLIHDRAYALDLQSARVRGGVFLDSVGDLAFEATGGVCMAGADVANLQSRGAELTGAAGEPAFRGDGLLVRGLATLGDRQHRFVAEGEVCLVAAQLGELRIEGASLDNPAQPPENKTGQDAMALNADRVTISGAVAISHLEANGAVRLAGARLGNALQLSDSVLDGYLTLEGATIDGRVYIQRLSTTPGRRQAAERPTCFDFTGLTARGALEMAEISAPPGDGDGDRPAGLYRLDGAAVAGLRDDPLTAWPNPGQLRLGGFTYGWITSIRDDEGAEVRLGWLDLQYPNERRFNPQPYEQLANVLRQDGCDLDALEVMKRKRAKELELSVEPSLLKTCARVMQAIGQGYNGEKALGYGYDSEVALFWTLRWWTLGVIWISLALYFGGVQFVPVHASMPRPRGATEQAGINYTFPGLTAQGVEFEHVFITADGRRPDWESLLHLLGRPEPKPAKSEEHCAGVIVPIYALELMVPIADLGQTGDCRLESSGFAGGLLQLWRVIYQVFGAVIIATLVIAVTGFRRKD